ncbi:MAG: glycosyltransferase family 2 protein [Rhodocyclaceae bacterium]
MTGASSDARRVEALSVVVPVLNEAENIEPLVREIRAALDGRLPFEIVYADDGSSDGTPAILARLARALPMLSVVRHRAPCGQSAALASGVRAARHPWIATLDGDGQNDPADIPRLIEAIEDAQAPAGLCMAVGWRTRRNDDWLRRVSSRVANTVRAAVLGDATPDTGCGLKLFPRAVFLELPHFDHMHRFLPALVRRQGGLTVSVPVAHRARTRGRSKYGVHDRLWVGIVDLAGVAWLKRRMRIPLVEGPRSGDAAAGPRGDRET